VSFKLAPITVLLPPVEVIGERAVAAPSMVGATLLTRTQLPKNGSIIEALQGAVPGLQTHGRGEYARQSIRGSRSDVLYVINGAVITPPLTFYIDAADVDCVEVRRGYRAANEIRPSFVGETYSGVILIWTRGSLTPRPEGCPPS
jgi:hypothetical protein